MEIRSFSVVSMYSPVSGNVSYFQNLDDVALQMLNLSFGLVNFQHFICFFRPEPPYVSVIGPHSLYITLLPGYAHQMTSTCPPSHPALCDVSIEVMLRPVQPKGM